MEIAIGAARWVVGRALSPVTDGLLESWAACSELGPNVSALKLQLLYAQAMLDNARGREIRSPALGELLLELRHHAYNADDVLDELEYFRVQDELEGTYETTDNRGVVTDLVLNARHTARAVASKLKIPSCSCAVVCKQHRKPKVKFDRVEMSKRMAEIVEKLKPVCAIVSTILDTELLGSAIHKLDLIASNNTTSLQGSALNLTRNTTPHIIEPKLYGRDDLKKGVVDEITHGKYSADDLTVISIVGPGGLGKTKFTQHIYDEVKNQFQVPIWICVSQNNFSANRLAQEIVKQIPKGENERENASAEELIEKRLQSKQFLLVLDDMWTYHEDEWKRLLAPFRKGGTKGNMVIVTTRIPRVAQMVTTIASPLRLERLKEEDCMLFFEACVFGDNQSWEKHTNLRHVGREIVKRLKGFPLAVTTVGRLLKNELTLEYWTRVLDSKEWESQANDDDIMPALRLSYNYLPFNLQQCFSHCALFPEDYEFDSKELIHLWIGLGLLSGPDNQNKRIEDIGLDCLKGLVNHGFFQEEKKEDDHTYYVIHDLLHDLAVNVSAYECLSLISSNLRSIQIPASIRHLSITIEDEAVQDRGNFESCKKDLYALGKRLKVESLRTLIFFGDDHGSFCKSFGDIFLEAKALRVILLSGASYAVEDLFPNFSQLVHLRYLRIKGKRFNKISLSSSITRFYNLLVLDLKWCNYSGSRREISNLVKIRHFVGAGKWHTGICEVGKLKSIQELKRFEVKRENHGFELNQLGQLLQLQGSLGIYNLEKVEAVTEVVEANLVHMHHLNRLLLEWNINDESGRDKEKEEEVLEQLRPNSNLREVCITGHGGDTYPSWLGTDDFIENLECLCLDSVAWRSLPHLGELMMVGKERPCIADQIFKNLKKLELVKISALKKWSTKSPFSNLEELTISDCSELIELPFTHYTCRQEQREKNITMFPKLQDLHISKCANLLSVPQVPWSTALFSVEISYVGTSVPNISYQKNTQYISVTFRENASDPELWNVLAFSNLSEIKSFRIFECPLVPLHQLRMLEPLKHLWIQGCSFLWATEDEKTDQFQFPVEDLALYGFGATGKELTQLISYFPKLSKLLLGHCSKRGNGEEETDAAEEGQLFLPLQIKELSIIDCPDVRLCISSLQSQTSLTSLIIQGCPKLLSSNSCSASYCPFPTSLQYLSLDKVKYDMFTLTPLLNLTTLELTDCEGLIRSEDIWHLLAQGHLRELETQRSPNIFDCSEASRIMQALETDGESGYPAAPIRGHFCTSLIDLNFSFYDMEHFTREQSEALQMLTSLKFLRIYECSKLQSLPAGLSGLHNLKGLLIDNCDSIRSLPKGSLPSSLTKLLIRTCPAFRSLPKGSLPSSLTKLEIYRCPAMGLLHKDSLPSSLQTLDVRLSNKKLQRQCRKLKGEIPIVLLDD